MKNTFHDLPPFMKALSGRFFIISHIFAFFKNGNRADPSISPIFASLLPKKPGLPLMQPIRDGLRQGLVGDHTVQLPNIP